MMSPRTLRILMVVSQREKATAERAAAEAARKLAVLGGQAASLDRYVTDLEGRMVRERAISGYDLRSYGRFIEMGVRAMVQNADAIVAGEAAQEAALGELGRQTERHKAIRKSVAEVASATAGVLEKRIETQASAPGRASTDSGMLGRGGGLYPAFRHASTRQT